MEFIVKHGNQDINLISREYASIVTSATLKQTLMSEDIVEIEVSSARLLPISINDTINVFGKTYIINQLPTIKRSGNSFVTSITFEGKQYELIDKLFFPPEENGVRGDSLCFNLQTMVQYVLDNVNRDNSKKQFVLSECPSDTEYINMTFSNANCLKCLQDICNKWDVEFYLEETSTQIKVHIKKTIGEVNTNHVYQYGKNGGIYNLQRAKASGDIISRLYVYGGSDNLMYYRHTKLCLPNKNRWQSFIQSIDMVNAYGVREGVKVFDDVYPMFVGRVKALGDTYKSFYFEERYYDATTQEYKWRNPTFNLNQLWKAEDYQEWLALRDIQDSPQNQSIFTNDLVGKATKYLIQGTTATIHFQTGALSGYDIDIEHANTTTVSNTEIFLNPLVDENEYEFPSRTSSAFQIAVDDEFIILGINLPQEWKDSAEAELQTKAQEYYNENCKLQAKYTLDIEPIWLKQFVNSESEIDVFKVGDSIQIFDSEGGITSAQAIRINSIQRDLLNVYKYKLTLTDDVTIKPISRLVSDVNTLSQVVEMNQLTDPNKQRKTWNLKQEILSNVFDTDGYFTDAIRPNSIETQMLAVGARSQQFTISNLVIKPNVIDSNNTPQPSVCSWTSGTLSHYTIKEDGVRDWLITSGTASSIPSSYQYIYARCEKAEGSTSATLLITSAQYRYDIGDNYYYFLIGSLSSVSSTDNVRYVSLSYGFTTINGRFISTGRISSNDGNTYFDLDEGVIKGNIVFESGGEEKDLDTYITDLVGEVATEKVDEAIGSGIEEEVQRQLENIDVWGFENIAIGSRGEVTDNGSVQVGFVRYCTCGTLKSNTKYTLTACYQASKMPFTLINRYNNQWQWSKALTFPTSSTIVVNSVTFETGTINQNGKIEICWRDNPRGTIYWFVITEGTAAATQWTPATKAELMAWNEETQASADSAYQQAQTAISNINSYNSDLLISPTEKTALKQQLADIQAEYQDIVKQATEYSVSYASYTSAYNSAVSALNKYTASSPEHIGVDSDYNNIASYYNVRQALLKSITDSAKTYVSTKANEVVGNVKIGGANHMLNTASPSSSKLLKLKGASPSISGISLSYPTSGTIRCTSIATNTENFYRFTGAPSSSNPSMFGMNADVYTLSGFVCGSLSNSNAIIYVRIIQMIGTSYSNLKQQNIFVYGNSGTKKFEVSWTWATNAVSAIVSIQMANMAIGDYFEVSKLMLENGNKASDWVQSQDDIDTQISEAQQNAFQNAKNWNKYVNDALKGCTNINGGLVLTNMLGLGNITESSDGKSAQINSLTCGMNGASANADENVLRIWSGSSGNTLAEAENATFKVYDNGHVVLNDVDITSEDVNKNKLSLGNGAIQIVDASGEVLTAITQKRPSSITDATGGAQTVSKTADSSATSATNSGATATIINNSASYKYYFVKELGSLESLANGGTLKIPSMTMQAVFVMNAMQSYLTQSTAYLSYNVVVNGVSRKSANITSLSNYAGNNTNRSTTLNFAITETTLPVSADVTYKVQIQFEIRITMTGDNTKSSGTSIDVPYVSARVTPSASITTTISYASYLNQLFGNGFLFAKDSDRYMAYINSVGNTATAWMLKHYTMELIANANGLQFRDGASSFFDLNPIILTCHITWSNGTPSVTARYNPYNYSLTTQSSTDAKSIKYTKSDNGIIDFTHNFRLTNFQVFGIGRQSTAIVMCTNITKTNFTIRIDNSNGVATNYEADIMLLRC